MKKNDKVIYPTLKTKYIDDMDKTMPWNEYPRPSMVRDSFLCLNGKWDFAITKPGDAPEYKEQILVPFPPESLLSGIERTIPDGHLMHYRRRFTIPEGFNKGHIILHFGAVDTICTVYLNGNKLGNHEGDHEGGYLPFCFDITELLINGENELHVVVKDDLDPNYPYGKQTKNRGGMWYTPVSGIWQTVWLESVPESYVVKIKLFPTVSNVKIRVLGGAKHKKITLANGEAFEFDGEEINIAPKEIHLWSPEDPYLYYFTLECGEDKIESYFALREIGISKINGIPRLMLNGKPYLFNGLLDQGYYPDGIFLPATSKGYEDDILKMKECGFNMLRKHIKVEPEIFYHLCDKLGMVVFQDMVNNSDYSFFIDTALPTVGLKRIPILFRHKSKKSRSIFEEHMYGTLDHLHFFPSVLYYTIFNEGWGQFSADKMYSKAKAYDPTRIYDATSGWFWRRKSDVDSRHVYFKKVKIGRRDGRPIVISEFGGYSHRVKGHIFGESEYGYGGFETAEEYETALIKLYGEEIKPLISGGICALVYTQVSDVEDETNGLLTYDREILKVNSARIKAVMDDLAKEI
ncbi:MAG: glycoside hydrolase family 2 [Clostridia bacterium]|nr:glycoside hydrolase family 2 [Clostridia bacterium]